jgi:hypothetical protein
MHAFQASDPDSRPPPISAPDVPIFTLATPQSDPQEEIFLPDSNPV